MKQLKFFTNHAKTLEATQNELARKGISPSNLHIFIKDNSKHRYDGLILLSNREQENSALDNRIFVYVLLSLLAVIALFHQWISFLGFAIVMILPAVLPFVLNGLITSTCVKKDTLKKVYFLVIDVDEEKQDLVKSVVKNYPDLVLQ